MKMLSDLLIHLLNFPNLAFIMKDFLKACKKGHYRLSWIKCISLILSFISNCKKIGTASGWREHLVMSTEILSISPSVEGDIIECGCFKGGSTANLSLICKLVGRKLIVYDSFEGLPEPKKEDKYHMLADGRRVVYSKGEFLGTLEEVKENLKRYGCIDVCVFVPGWFQETLRHLDGPFVCAFLDVDLKESTKVCLSAIWPKLQPGCKLFSHEAKELEILSLFFDSAFFEKLNSKPPGFVGSGIGLHLYVTHNIGLGYAKKGIYDKRKVCCR